MTTYDFKRDSRPFTLKPPPDAPAARIVAVIETRGKRGAGTEASPLREIVHYFDLDGQWLAESDPLQKEDAE